MRTRRFELCRPDEIVAEKRRRPLVYLVFGPLEWHGPHLPLGTDPLRAYAIALEAASRTGGVVLPPTYFGTERERDPDMLEAIGLGREDYVVGMDFPANSMPSMYCKEELFALVVREQIELALAHGYRIVAIVNGHGAFNQIETIRRLVTEYSGRRPDARLLQFFPNVPDAAGRNNWGHADREEVCAMMYMHPYCVDLDALPPPDERIACAEHAIVDDATFRLRPRPDHTVSDEQDPRLHHDPEEGRRQTEQVVEQIVSTVQTALSEL